MELIDRNEVGAKIQAMYIRREMDYGGENEFCRGMRKALRIIEDAPTIEAEPVKHGRWVKSDTQRHVEVTYECSECQHEVVGEYEKTPFCGGCGARMMED